MDYVGLRVKEETKKKWEKLATAEGKTLTDVIKEGMENYMVLKRIDRVLEDYVNDGLFDDLNEARKYVLIECIAEGYIKNILEKYKKEVIR